MWNVYSKGRTFLPAEARSVRSASRHRNGNAWLFILTSFLGSIWLLLAGVEAALASPIYINSIADLQNIQSDLSGDYVLASDVDASGFDFAPIGSLTTGYGFSGTLNGNGHTISNLVINDSADVGVGLFGFIDSSGVVQNLYLTNALVTGSYQGLYSGEPGGAARVGILAGDNGGTITNVSVNGVVTSNHNAGGLVGLNGGTISQSSSTGSVIIGDDRAIEGNNLAAGGLVGLNIGEIHDAYSRSSVVSDSGNVYPAMGGLVGQNGDFVAGYASGGLIRNTYATGAIAGSGTSGGLVGLSGGAGYIFTSYWDTQTASQSNGVGFDQSVADVTGLTTVELQSGALPAGFDPSIWNASSGRYPTLKFETNDLPPPSSSQLASVVSAWADYIDTAKTSNPQAEADKLINCASDPSCDIDATAHEYQENIQTAAQKADAAATSSESLILETLPDPASKLDMVTWIATNAADIIDNLVSIFDLIAGDKPSPDKQISITNILTQGYSLEAAAAGGNYFDITIDAQLSDDELANLVLNQPIPNEFELPSGDLAYGEATFISAIDPPGIGTVQIRFREFEPNSVSEAPSWLIVLGGLCFFVVCNGRKLKKQSSGAVSA